MLAFNEQASKYRSLNNWFKTPPGVWVARAFKAELSHVHDELYGERLLQIGNCGDNLWLESLRYQHKWIVNPCRSALKETCVTSLTALPLDRSSVDCIIAPLTMEAFAQDDNPIEEMDRVLKPMGYIIFFGINPWSFWGLALRSKYISCFSSDKVNLTSSFSIRRTMLYRGYRQCLHNSFYYIPPVMRESLLQKLEFFNEMGKMFWPFPAGFYCLIMQKYQICPPSLLLEIPNYNTTLAEAK